jgi:hypothetical protein
MSRSGVTSMQSRPRTEIRLPDTFTTLTIDVPMGLGRTGDRMEKVPCTSPLFAGLWSTMSRRDSCNQYRTSRAKCLSTPLRAEVQGSNTSMVQSGPLMSPCRGVSPRVRQGVWTIPMKCKSASPTGGREALTSFSRIVCCSIPNSITVQGPSGSKPVANIILAIRSQRIVPSQLHLVSAETLPLGTPDEICALSEFTVCPAGRPV